MKDSKFKIGDKATICHTNPGYEGIIIGVVSPFLAGNVLMPENYFIEFAENTAKFAKMDVKEVFNSFVYYLFFDTPKLSSPNSDPNAPKVQIMTAFEIDLMTPDEYWASLESEISKEDV